MLVLTALAPSLTQLTKYISETDPVGFSLLADSTLFPPLWSSLNFRIKVDWNCTANVIASYILDSWLSNISQGWLWWFAIDTFIYFVSASDSTDAAVPSDSLLCSEVLLFAVNADLTGPKHYSNVSTFYSFCIILSTVLSRVLSFISRLQLCMTRGPVCAENADTREECQMWK